MTASISTSTWQIPVDFMITKAPLGLTGAGDLTVYDANGNLVFRIKRCSSSSPRRIKTLFDAEGNPLITVVHHNDGWQAFRGNNHEWKDLIFTMQKTLYSPFKTELEVVLPGRNQGDLKPSFRLKGNPFWRSCTIFRGDSIFAQVMRKEYSILALTPIIYDMNGRVGKTSLVLRYVNNIFSEKQQATVQASYLTKRLVIEAALLVYDITDNDSFVRVRKWVKELQQMASKNIIMTIAANKSDLVRSKKFDIQEAESYAATIGSRLFLTSAKSGTGVEEAFLDIATPDEKIWKNDLTYICVLKFGSPCHIEDTS
ncbi:putative ras-related protein Rab-21 [Cocos nucifera]|uniref:Putative ras-related protein Rab-21 n=1 Tax=Cocos nucifera TaxID=13894 RepID=A0A8K0I6P7_COCNU|nr:putative ras-related protein Rab-21 [Cocos nucifera]